MSEECLYDLVTAQLEEEFDAAGYDGETETLAALERIKASVNVWLAQRSAASSVSSGAGQVPADTIEKALRDVVSVLYLGAETDGLSRIVCRDKADRAAAALAALRTPEEQMRPDFARCGRCGADSAGCSWDPVDGWCCSNCGGCDADE